MKSKKTMSEIQALPDRKPTEAEEKEFKTLKSLSPENNNENKSESGTSRTNDKTS